MTHRTWQELATAVATAWAAPRVGGFAPSADLAYLAQVAYWQAVNYSAFTGTTQDWIAACEAQLLAQPIMEARPAPIPAFSREPSVEPPPLLQSPTPESLPIVALNPFGDDL